MKNRYVFLKDGSDGNGVNTRTAMLGAVIGDVAGSFYEHHNIKHCPDTDKLIDFRSRFTDDSVMTCAVAEGIANALKKLPCQWLTVEEHENVIRSELVKSMVSYGSKHLRAGFGGRFITWILSGGKKHCDSFGNGSAMRVSYAGWIARTLEEAERLGELSAKVSHGHPEGIKGAVAVAGSIFILRATESKEEVRKYVKGFYDIDFTLDGIRDGYTFDVTCRGSVPQAIVAFLEGESFADVISKAISIGGDSDTIAAIAGSLAEVIYGVPEDMQKAAADKLSEDLLDGLENSVLFLNGYNS